MREGKTALVSGATGLIGSRIVRKLINEGCNHVIAVGRSEAKLKKIFGEYRELPSFEYLVHDMCEPLHFNSLTQYIKGPINSVYHAASPISGAAIQKSPVDVIKPNLLATQNILEQLVNQQNKTGIQGRMVIFSSATVYGRATDTDITVKETDTMSADLLDSIQAPYSESKRMIEVIAHGYIRQYGVDAVIIRPSYVYGSAFFPPATAMYEFIFNALSGQDINLATSNTGKRDNIYIDDVISGIFTVFNKGKTGEAYNISSGGQLGNFAAIDEIAETISRISGEELPRKIAVHYKTPQSGARKPGIILDNSKLCALGWKLKKDLIEGIRNTLLDQAKEG